MKDLSLKQLTENFQNSVKEKELNYPNSKVLQHPDSDLGLDISFDKDALDLGDEAELGETFLDINGEKVKIYFAQYNV